MHSVAMGAGARNGRDSDLTVGSPAWTDQPSARLVRLSQLRKLCECEQVAAVCYRWRNDCIEFLLVRTRGGERWTFPKGSAEPGLTHAQAAALEAFEEAGVHGRIEEASFATYVRRERRGGAKSHSRSGENELAVSAHLCEVSRLSPPKEARRSRTWFSAAEARRRLQEGRQSNDGAEFTRVINKAVDAHPAAARRNCHRRRFTAGSSATERSTSGHVAKRRLAESALRSFRGRTRSRSFVHAEHSTSAKRDAAIRRSDCRGSFS